MAAVLSSRLVAPLTCAIGAGWRAHGCTHTIVSTREDIAKRVRELTNGKGVSVVFDSISRDTLTASLDSLQTRGTLVSNGTISGPVNIDTRMLAGKGSLWVTRPAMVHYATPRSHMLAMADAAQAHRALEGRQTMGATVLVP